MYSTPDSEILFHDDSSVNKRIIRKSVRSANAAHCSLPLFYGVIRAAQT